ncbi:hypothetical protein [Pseudemcibacter sp.]|uniref:hypothetical protein n=1 Tax=Pseudemcibacter sp. TaxID=2943293 RepID=UPI003F6987D9
MARPSTFPLLLAVKGAISEGFAMRITGFSAIHAISSGVNLTSELYAYKGFEAEKITRILAKNASINLEKYFLGLSLFTFALYSLNISILNINLNRLTIA